jgi:hypothetical protein
VVDARRPEEPECQFIEMLHRCRKPFSLLPVSRGDERTALPGAKVHSYEVASWGREWLAEYIVSAVTIYSEHLSI